MRLGQVNNLSFKGVVVEHHSKEEVTKELAQKHCTCIDKLNIKEVGDSVELSVPQKLIEEDLSKSSNEDASDQIEAGVITAEFILYKLFQSVGFKTKLTGETADLALFSHIIPSEE